MYRGLSHKGTTCYRHSNFFMVTKDKGGRGGVPERKAVEKTRKRGAPHSHTYSAAAQEREVPERGSFAAGERLRMP